MRTVRVRRHVRTIKGRVCEIPAHWRYIAALTGAEGVRVEGTVMQRTSGENDGA